MKNIMNKVILLCLLVFGLSIHAEDKWRFITIADWHSAEKYTQSQKNPEWFPEAVAKDIAASKMLKKNYGGDLILFPGDSNGGHWDTAKFINRFEKGLTPEESILKAGKLCYEGMIKSFNEGGYSTLLMAVGDHELGDNPWPVNSAVSRCQPQFREAFFKAFNSSADGGKFLYDKKIGDAKSRPIGTKYQDTSYAYKHKNVLFVTVDVFHQESQDKAIGSQGSVTGAVTGQHLEWLDKVLSEARKDPSINHIFVQAHLPVIYPVRKVNSSGMMMDDYTESEFWKTLRKHKVDVYLAGEVHSNTLTKDPESDLVQLVSRGNFFSNFMTSDVTDDRVEFTLYNQTGPNPQEGKYEVSGRFTIDKSGDNTVLKGEGDLAFLDPDGRQYYFDFEEESDQQKRPVIGMSKPSKKENFRSVRGIKCSKTFPNKGQFGQYYDALQGGIELVDGPKGKAGKFDDKSRMAVFGMGPHHGDKAVSYALWVKSTSKDNQLLINSGRIWGRAITGFLNLNLNDGIPEVMFSDKQKLVGGTEKLNDGKWHHLAVSMPKDGCKLSEVQIYADGKPLKTKIVGNDCKLKFEQSVRLSIGGLGYTSKSFDKLPVKPFVGELDEISIWTRSLSMKEVTELAVPPEDEQKTNEKK